MTKGALLILVNDKNEVLLQHKDKGAPTHPGMWCLFGGGIEAGESARETIHRELVEELEWHLDDISTFASYPDNDVFYAKTRKHADSLRRKLHEGDDLGFFTQAQVLGMNVAGPHLQALKDYFERRES